jgi:hypothetical protein
MMARFAKIGIGPGKPFYPDQLAHEIRAAIEQGAADAEKELKEKLLAVKSSRIFSARGRNSASTISWPVASAR